MVMEIKVLIVEDDETQVNNWNMAIESHNASAEDEGFSVNHSIKRDKVTALEYIKENDIDAAILDIRLGSDHNQDGGIILNKILESELAVVVILSGEPGVQELLPEWNPKVKNIVKGNNGIQQTLDWLKAQVPMLRQIKAVQRDIKREMVKLFSRSIWPRWDYWISNAPTDLSATIFIQNSLARHLTAHVYAEFLERTHHKVHQEEWFFVPPIRNGLRTGDLITSPNGDIEIILTPRCDLAQAGKTEFFQLAKCTDISAKWNQAQKNYEEAETSYQKIMDIGSTPEGSCVKCSQAEIDNARKKRDSAKSKFRSLSSHDGNKNVSHFLPQISLIDGTKKGPFFINFSEIRSVHKSDEKSIKTITGGRFASITTEFLPSVVERFGSYYSRIGTPDYSHNE
jgi:hypothetical protein